MDVIRVSNIIYAILSVTGLILLFLAIATADAMGAAVGMGAVTLGALGMEAQYTNRLIIKSREVK